MCSHKFTFHVSPILSWSILTWHSMNFRLCEFIINMILPHAPISSHTRGVICSNNSVFFWIYTRPLNKPLRSKNIFQSTTPVMRYRTDSMRAWVKTIIFRGMLFEIYFYSLFRVMFIALSVFMSRFLFHWIQFLIISLMNAMCEKTRAYTSGIPLPHGANPQDTIPTRTFRLVINGPPESPIHKPCATGLFVQIVLRWTDAPDQPKRLTQSGRAKLFVSLNCKNSGWWPASIDGGPAYLMYNRKIINLISII